MLILNLKLFLRKLRFGVVNLTYKILLKIVNFFILCLSKYRTYHSSLVANELDWVEMQKGKIENGND